MLRKVERRGRWHGRRLDYPSLYAIPRIGILVLVENGKAMLEIEVAGGVFHFHSAQEVEEFRGSCLNLLERAQIDADRGPPPPPPEAVRAWNEGVFYAWGQKGEAY